MKLGLDVVDVSDWQLDLRFRGTSKGSDQFRCRDEDVGERQGVGEGVWEEACRAWMQSEAVNLVGSLEEGCGHEVDGLGDADVGRL